MAKPIETYLRGKNPEKLLERDLSDYLTVENLEPFPFEYVPKQKSVNLRISEELLKAVRAAAGRRGIPYQRYIRQALGRALRLGSNGRTRTI
jgi:predicted DNA binding CopG/RHH family protein